MGSAIFPVRLPGTSPVRPSSSKARMPRAAERAKTPTRPVAFSSLSTVITFRSFTGNSSERCGASGNGERVTAVTYGLRPGDYRLLSKLENVEFFPSPNPRAHPSYARIRDFQNVIANWPDNTPVAFWDAGDVLFQGRIDDLWGLVRAHPGELLVVPEPFRYPENPAISAWTSSIRDFKARRERSSCSRPTPS